MREPVKPLLAEGSGAKPTGSEEPTAPVVSDVKRPSVMAAATALRNRKTLKHMTHDKIMPALRTTKRLKNMTLALKLVETKASRWFSLDVAGLLTFVPAPTGFGP